MGLRTSERGRAPQGHRRTTGLGRQVRLCAQPQLLESEVCAAMHGMTTVAVLRVLQRPQLCTAACSQSAWCAGDPRGAGIGTPEAIRLVWSCHREIVHDFGPYEGDPTQLPCS